MGTKAKDMHSEAPCQNEGPGQEASSEAVGRNSKSGEEAMPSKGQGKKCAATLCNQPAPGVRWLANRAHTGVCCGAHGARGAPCRSSVSLPGVSAHMSGGGVPMPLADPGFGQPSPGFLFFFWPHSGLLVA